MLIRSDVAITFLLLLQHHAFASELFVNNDIQQHRQLSWVFGNVAPRSRESALQRIRRSPARLHNNWQDDEVDNLIDAPNCRGDLKRICGINTDNDDLLVLECFQNLKVNNNFIIEKIVFI